MSRQESIYKCSNCGTPAEAVLGNYPFRESGLSNVVLKNVQIVSCTQCGNRDPIISKMSEVMNLLVSSVVKQPSPLTGEEIRFLRKHISMNAETFASYVGVDKTTLSKWENEQISVGTASDRLMRVLVSAKAPETKLEEI